MKLESYKNRHPKPHLDVWVYRNLMRTEGVWYSLLQGGIVVAHAKDVSLLDVRFVVREGGRRRVLETGVKNVHAFVVGRLNPLGPGGHPFGPPEVLAHRGRYNPKRASTFEVAELPVMKSLLGPGEHAAWKPCSTARAAHLGSQGLTVWGAS